MRNWWMALLVLGAAGCNGEEDEPKPPNRAPVAVAGADRQVTIGELVRLSGTNSSDPDGDVLSYTWTLDSTPASSAAMIDQPASPRPTFGVDEPGRYVVSLVVNDGSVDSAPATVTFNTVNRAPVASAGMNSRADVGDTVMLDGSRSVDPDNDPLTYEWRFAASPAGSTPMLDAPTSVTPSFVASVMGIYDLTLRVSDGELESDLALVSIRVGLVNRAPVAEAGNNRNVRLNATVTLDSSASSDPDADAILPTWSLTNRPAGSTAQLVGASSVMPTFVADALGDYTLLLTVTDGELTSLPDTVTITAVQNTPPVANAGAAATVTVGGTVTLDGSASSDPEGDMLGYTWTLASKPTGSVADLSATDTVNPSFLADLEGAYVASLVVSDGESTSPASMVTITARPPIVRPAPPLDALAIETELLEIHGLRSDAVWAAGNNGGLLKWDGTRWSYVTGLTVRSPLMSLWVLAEDDIWVGGSQGVLQHYDGQSWTAIQGTGGNLAYDIWAASSNSVWIATGQTVFHWDGSTMTDYPIPTASQSPGLFGFSDTDIWLVQSDSVYRWDGTSWNIMASGPGAGGSKVWGSAPNDVWIQNGGSVHHWDGQALTETEVVTGTMDGTVRGTSPTDVWHVSSGAVSHYDGQSWTPITGAHSGLVFREVWPIGPDDVWGAGDAGLLAHWDGTSWTHYGRLPSAKIVGMHEGAADDILLVHADSNGSGYTRWDGQRWRTYPEFSPDETLAVHGSAGNNVWAVGGFGQLDRWNGSSWSNHGGPLLGTFSVLSVRTFGPNDAWAGTRDGVLRWDGSTWSSVLSDQYGSYAAIAGDSSSDLWIATTADDLHRWDGSAWSTIARPQGINTGQLVGLLWRAADDIWWTGAEGVHQWDGTQWNLSHSPATYITGFFGNAEDLWVAEPRGTFRNDGTGWTADGLAQLTKLFNASPSGRAWGIGSSLYERSELGWARRDSIDESPLMIWANSPTDVWVGRQHGTVSHYDGTAWRSVKVNVNQQIDCLWSPGAGEVWTCTDDEVFRFTGDGFAELVAGVDARDIWGTSPTDVWVVGGARNGQPNFSHWDGSTFTATQIGTLPALSVYGTASDDIYAAAGSNIYHWDGSSWTAQGQPPTMGLEFVRAGGGHLLAASQDVLIGFEMNDWRQLLAAPVPTQFKINGPNDIVGAGNDNYFHFNGTDWSANPVAYLGVVASGPSTVNLLGRVDAILRPR